MQNITNSSLGNAELPEPLAELIAAMERHGWQLLPDAVEGYGAVMLAAHKEREAAVAIAHLQPGSLPLLALTTRPGHRDEDIAEVLRIARRALIPSLDRDDDRQVVTKLALALAPSQMFLISSYDQERGGWNRWVTSVPRDPKPAFLSRLAVRIVSNGGQVLPKARTPQGYAAVHILPELVPLPVAVAVHLPEHGGMRLLSLSVREGREEADTAQLLRIAASVALPDGDTDPRRLIVPEFEHDDFTGYMLGGFDPTTDGWLAITGGLPLRDEPPV